MKQKQILKTPAGSAGSPLWELVSCEEREYPLGLTQVEGGIHVSVAVDAKECTLLLFPHRGADWSMQEQDAEPIRIAFPESGHVGTVWEMTLKGTGFDQYDYAFEIDGKAFSDPCGRSFSGQEIWGDLSRAGSLLKARIHQEPFDWEGDCSPQIPYEESIVYCAHVRGLTMHESSGVENKGTFAGVAEKIPYLKELGITTLELLPVTEFPEVMMPDTDVFDPYRTPEPTGKLNYWGYGPSFLYAPKASYGGADANPVHELKKLVKQLHQEGMELVIQLYFTGEESAAFVLDVVRFWKREYHVDGVHLTGEAPVEALLRDPYLTRTKIWVNSLDGVDLPTEPNRHFGEYNDGFLIDMRRILKGDAGMLGAMAMRTLRNPDQYGVLNYMAGVNGFTLADMVSYEEKHNEKNGEKNRDGSNYNCTWNCGEEGPTENPRREALRRQQVRNALLMLFLSQGTPVLLAGDEFGNSQSGNNNAYCQDNETGWVDWSMWKQGSECYDFVKNLIAFRKSHPVFHRQKELKQKDYLAYGCPDVSFHGAKAWRPELDDFRRQLGVFYWGNYAERTDGSPDDHFFVAYNLYKEPRELALPKLPALQKWYVVIDSHAEEVNGIYKKGQEILLPVQKKCMVPARTILVLKTSKKP